MSYLRYLHCLRIVVSNTYCVFLLCFFRLVYSLLPVSLNYPFLIATSVFSDMYVALFNLTSWAANV